MVKKIALYTVYFGVLAGLGILLGCYIHAARTHQTTVMSGVAFVRELPFGEQIVGRIETEVFSREERDNLKKYREQHKDIKIDPDVLKKHQQLYREGAPR